VLLLLSIVLFYVLFVCKCVLYYCHRVSIQLRLRNILYRNISHLSYHISYHIVPYYIIYHLIYHIMYHIIYIIHIIYRIIPYIISYHIVSSESQYPQRPRLKVSCLIPTMNFQWMIHHFIRTRKKIFVNKKETDRYVQG
jgi:hypothetical protein